MFKRISIDDLPEHDAAAGLAVTDEELAAVAGGCEPVVLAPQAASFLGRPCTCHISGGVDCD